MFHNSFLNEKKLFETVEKERKHPQKSMNWLLQDDTKCSLKIYAFPCCLAHIITYTDRQEKNYKISHFLSLHIFCNEEIRGCIFWTLEKCLIFLSIENKSRMCSTLRNRNSHESDKLTKFGFFTFPHKRILKRLVQKYFSARINFKN